MADGGKIRQQLISALLKNGQVELGNIWSCSAGEVSKRISGERNINIEDMANALASAGIKIITDESMVIVHQEELDALNLLGSRYLASRIHREK